MTSPHDIVADIDPATLAEPRGGWCPGGGQIEQRADPLQRPRSFVLADGLAECEREVR